MKKSKRVTRAALFPKWLRDKERHLLKQAERIIISASEPRYSYYINGKNIEEYYGMKVIEYNKAPSD